MAVSGGPARRGGWGVTDMVLILMSMWRDGRGGWLRGCWFVQQGEAKQGELKLKQTGTLAGDTPR
jgi:hypothetical protein